MLRFACSEARNILVSPLRGFPPGVRPSGPTGFLGIGKLGEAFAIPHKVFRLAVKAPRQQEHIRTFKPAEGGVDSVLFQQKILSILRDPQVHNCILSSVVYLFFKFPERNSRSRLLVKSK